MTTSSSSTRPPQASDGLWQTRLRASLVVLAAFALGLVLGLKRPSPLLAIAIVGAVAAILFALAICRRRRRPPPARLRPLGLSAVFSVKLDGGTLILGRGQHCDVTLPLETVSAEHCRVFKTPSGWFVEDLGSRNGTRINGKPIRKRRLRIGDTLSVADFEFRVC